MRVLHILAARAPKGCVFFTSFLMTINEPPKLSFLQAYFIRQKFLRRLPSKNPPFKMTPSGFHPEGPPSHCEARTCGAVRGAACSEQSFQTHFTLQTCQEQR